MALTVTVPPEQAKLIAFRFQRMENATEPEPGWTDPYVHDELKFPAWMDLSDAAAEWAKWCDEDGADYAFASGEDQALVRVTRADTGESGLYEVSGEYDPVYNAHAHNPGEKKMEVTIQDVQPAPREA